MRKYGHLALPSVVPCPVSVRRIVFIQPRHEPVEVLFDLFGTEFKFTSLPDFEPKTVFDILFHYVVTLFTGDKVACIGLYPKVDHFQYAKQPFPCRKLFLSRMAAFFQKPACRPSFPVIISVPYIFPKLIKYSIDHCFSHFSHGSK